MHSGTPGIGRPVVERTNSILSKTSFRRFLRRELWGYIFIFPSLLLFAVFVLYPLVRSFYISMFVGVLGEKEWIGLHNYGVLFRDDVFLRSLLNTFLFVGYTTPIVVVLSLLLAVLLIEKSARLQTFLRAAYYLPVVISIVSISLVWRILYNRAYGILNYMVSLIGFEPVNWLGDRNIVIPALSIVILSYSLGRPIILYLAGLGGIPITYYEAAEIDGANPWVKFWRITFPLVMPTTLFIVVTTTIAAFQVFAIINLTTSGGPNYASSTVLYLIYVTAFLFNNMSLSAAMGVILFFCAASFSIFQFILFSKSIEY